MHSSETELKEKSIDVDNPLGLTPELKKIADAFEAIGDDKLRYKQLLFMANQAKPMDPASQIPENQVPGCLSTVYVDGTAEQTDDGDYVINFVGDSDGLLTKGLVALLVRGLSGNSAEAIQKVDPAFIQKAGISTSLTPGRNNGFLNMLKVMKRKALELDAAARSGASHVSTNAAEDEASVDGTDRPMYAAMVNALQKLQPQSLDLMDVSYQHAGHMEGGGTETHFELDIVADAFEGLNLVKRHKLVYMMLGDVMPKIHALQIRAKTPAEVTK
jgi:sulfur transfer protein SufE/stress-induced morphogen